MKRISIKNKLLLNSVIIIAFTIIMILIGFLEFNGSKKLADHIAPLNQQMTELVRLKSHFEHLELIMEEYFLIGGERYKTRIKDIFNSIAVSIEQLEHHSYKFNLIKKIKNKSLILNKLIERLLNKEIHFISNKEKNELIIKIYSEIRRINHLQKSYSEQALAKLNFYIEAQQKALKKSISEFFILGIIIIIFYLIYGLTLSNRISNPLLKLTNAATEIYKGNLEIEITADSNDEISDLAKIFNKMAKQLLKKINDLKKSEEQYRDLVENTNNLISRVNEQGCFTYVNHIAKKAFGVWPDECIGISMFSFIDDKDRKRTKNWFSKCIYSQEINSTVEYRIVSTTGKISDMLWTVSFHYDKQGHITHINSIGRDISKLKAAEKELKDFTQRLLIHVEQTPLGVIEWDLNFRVVQWNPSAEKIFGYTRQEALGRHAVEIILPEMEREKVDLIWQDLMTNTGGTKSTNRNISKDGKLLTCDWYNTTLVDNNDVIIGVASLVQDISEAKKLEDQLQQAHKMEAIGTIAGGIAHDFNNILGIVLGNAELAIDDIPEQNTARQNLKEIEKASLRAKEIVQQLLSFTRKSVQEKKALKIQDIVEETLGLLRASIPTFIELKTDIQSDAGSIEADPTHIHQILINLCTNAIHAIEDGGIMEIKVSEIKMDTQPVAFDSELSARAYIKLVVSDNGIGIPKDIKDKIFDPYFTTKDVGKGTGMGLAVVHGIVKNNNGEIFVDSEFGKGTTFTILFPKIVEKIEVTAKATHTKSTPSGKEKILFVDDEKSIVQMAKSILERLGYTVQTSTNPVKALSIFEADPDRFDLVISDVTMPYMSGSQLSKKIKMIRPDIPIIICTGHISLREEEKARNVDITAYAMKPISMSEIAKLVRSVLDPCS